jgi:hypothetical protein
MMINISLYYISTIVLAIKAGEFLKIKKFTAMMFPIYLVLILITVIGAIIDICKSPYYWNKTKHYGSKYFCANKDIFNI